MTAPRDDVPVRYIHPGQWYAGRGRRWLYTVLGSCVAMVFWHGGRRVGGLCHYVLPGPSPQGSGNGHYAEDALLLLTAALRDHGCEPAECRVGVYGGGRLIPGGSPPHYPQPGERNIADAWHLVREYGLTVAEQDLGDACYRRIRVHLQDGRVWVERYRWTGSFSSEGLSR